MGKLKPIGSEKLQGMEKINRMIEISRYKENIPTSINEDVSVEYSKVLSDGYTYRIDKEKNGYVIKKGISESSADYLDPMKSRKYYSSYSQAFKRLNLIVKEVNQSTGNDKNISLFNEEDESGMKYFLKTSMEEQAPPAAAPAPAPVPAPTGMDDEAPAPTGMDDEAPAPEGMDDETPSPEGEGGMDDEEPATFKTVQKLTGKLAQKIRTLSQDEENPISSKDMKYVINSVLSAFNLDNLEEEDRDEIIMKFEGEEEGMGDEESMGGEEEMSPEAPESPQPEMGGEMAEMFDEVLDYGDFETPKRTKPKKIQHRGMKDYEAAKVEEMIEGMFTESRVDKILTKYFNVDETEKVLTEQKKKSREELVWKLGVISENIEQEVISRKLIKKYKEAKLLGKDKNKNLVFEVNQTKVRVSPNGRIL
jgi:hypothetical protein